MDGLKPQKCECWVCGKCGSISDYHCFDCCMSDYKGTNDFTDSSYLVTALEAQMPLGEEFSDEEFSDAQESGYEEEDYSAGGENHDLEEEDHEDNDEEEGRGNDEGDKEEQKRIDEKIKRRRRKAEALAALLSLEGGGDLTQGQFWPGLESSSSESGRFCYFCASTFIFSCSIPFSYLIWWLGTYLQHLLTSPGLVRERRMPTRWISNQSNHTRTFSRGPRWSRWECVCTNWFRVGGGSPNSWRWLGLGYTQAGGQKRGGDDRGRIEQRRENWKENGDIIQETRSRKTKALQQAGCPLESTADQDGIIKRKAFSGLVFLPPIPVRITLDKVSNTHIGRKRARFGKVEGERKRRKEEEIVFERRGSAVGQGTSTTLGSSRKSLNEGKKVGGASTVLGARCLNVPIAERQKDSILRLSKIPKPPVRFPSSSRPAVTSRTPVKWHQSRIPIPSPKKSKLQTVNENSSSVRNGQENNSTLPGVSKKQHVIVRKRSENLREEPLRVMHLRRRYLLALSGFNENQRAGMVENSINEEQNVEVELEKPGDLIGEGGFGVFL